MYRKLDGGRSLGQLEEFAEETVRALVDYFDVIGLEIEDIPTTSRFGRSDNVCHDRFEISMKGETQIIE
jgi:hypothetical protein